jgi:uncharacterized protein
LSPTAGAGPQSQALEVQNTYNAQGQLVSSNPARMAPLYQVEALPGTNTQAFTISDAYVPASESNTTGSGNRNLTAFLVGNSDPAHYGQLTLYQTPQGTPGPANADSYIQANNTVSKDITLLDQHGSQVLLGNTLMVPVGQSIIYLRPLYVASTTTPLPQLTYVIGVIGQRVVIENSLSATLTDLFQTPVATSGSSSTSSSSTSPTVSGTLPTEVQQELQAAQTLYTQATAALKSGNLGTYQGDITAMDTQIAAAEQQIKSETGTSTTTPTTTPKSSGKSTSKKTSSKSSTTTTSLKTSGSKDSTSSTSTEPKETTTSTTLSAAQGAP